jgi:hypothetical protein
MKPATRKRAPPKKAAAGIHDPVFAAIAVHKALIKESIRLEDIVPDWRF